MDNIYNILIYKVMKEKYTHKKLEELGEKVIDWCLNEFGLSKHYNDYPYMDIVTDEEGICGEFFPHNNQIIICTPALDSIDEFIDTVIHEYTHYMQSPTWYTRYSNPPYRKNELTVEEFGDYLLRGDPTHPYEIQAVEVAKKNMNKCKNEVLK